MKHKKQHEHLRCSQCFISNCPICHPEDHRHENSPKIRLEPNKDDMLKEYEIIIKRYEECVRRSEALNKKLILVLDLQQNIIEKQEAQIEEAKYK